MDQTNRKGNPEINPGLYNQLHFCKGLRHTVETVCLINAVGKIGCACTETKTRSLSLTMCKAQVKMGQRTKPSIWS
jgi:hypothetical protein